MVKVDVKIEDWKKKLLDTGKRNRLINYKETKRSNLNIVTPGLDSIYKTIVINEKPLLFSYPKDVLFDDLENDENDAESQEKIVVIPGNIETNKKIDEQQKTLKVLRARAKTAMEEMGINVLYLSFGFLNWSEKKGSSETLSSPLVLVPVSLVYESITSPYKLVLNDDEIVINPTLQYKLENDFGLKLPEFDSEENITSFLKKIEKIIEQSGWSIEYKVGLSLLSFLKINMYYDLENRAADIKNNAVIKALCGNTVGLSTVPDGINNYDHDSNNKPIDIYQVVDADSSQQDAILLSKKGVSFVLQGPPGTGKSQTITNIISEALAEGKKVLFVSEKMAALDVVHRRLSAAGLEDFCLILHSHKTNKKEVIASLGKTLNQNKIILQKEALYKLDILKKERDKLNDYAQQLHTRVQPLNMTIYEVNGYLAKLRSAPDLIFTFDNIKSTTPENLNTYAYLITELSKTMGKMSEDYDSNSWKGNSITYVSHELRHDIESCLDKLAVELLPAVNDLKIEFKNLSLDLNISFDDIPEYIDFVRFCSSNPVSPSEWFFEMDINMLIEQAIRLKEMQAKYLSLTNELTTFYNTPFFEADASETSFGLSKNERLFEIYYTDKDIFETEINKLIEQTIQLKETQAKYLSLTDELAAFYNAAFLEAGAFGTLPSMYINERLFEKFNDPYYIDKDIFEMEINKLIEQEIQLKETQAKYFSLTDELKAFYNASFFEIDAFETSSNLSKNYEHLFEIFNDRYSTEKDIFENSSKLIDICSNFKTDAETLFRSGERIANRLGIDKPVTIGENHKFLELIDLLTQDLRIPKLWFTIDDEQKEQLKNVLLKKAVETVAGIKRQKGDLFKKYKKEVLDLPAESLLSAYEKDYKSVFKNLNKDYRNDRKLIKSLKLNPAEGIDDKEILALLNDLKKLNENLNWMKQNDSVFKNCLGNHYFGEETNFDNIEKSMEIFDEIKKSFNGVIPNQIQELLVSHKNYKLFSEELLSLEPVFRNSHMTDYLEVVRKPIFKTTEFKTIITETAELISVLSEVNNLVSIVTSESKQIHDYNFHRESLNKLSQIQQIRKEMKKKDQMIQKQYQQIQNEMKKKKQMIQEQHQQIQTEMKKKEKLIQKQYPKLISGLQTDWEKILTLLLSASKLSNYFEKYSISKELQIEIISGNSRFNQTAELVRKLDSVYKKCTENLEWLDSLFDKEHSILKSNLYALLDKIEGCRNNLAGLEEWIDFRTAKENCEMEGLGNFINIILEKNIERHLLLDAFNKRFFRLWLDAILPRYPAVNGFRRRNQEDTIKNFVGLDKTQMEIAQLRVKERLYSNLPYNNGITVASDEVNVLKRELTKQRRILPLRKLFEKLPNLLPCLKPCLMMSPLSVSLFLQSDRYNFDMVIFDEASQVCTENAIGSIIRSKQVIIAGDSKQLPPTNFFNATSSGEDFDTDDEIEEDDFVYDSVLDEALTVLPERSLTWHYRSKHEHLIAFSNSKIYNNSLTTFPSSVEKIPGFGVEYIYTEDGIYDRSGKRNNMAEAKKVAELVFEHFHVRPDYSLGVIAFSSSQQQAIESAVLKMRSEHQEFEYFFNEENEEAFFIKNLENVQGDERDVIIFSIGYAKDSNGKMYMNFGPVSREGGYRRLNVAITRAKYNVKLVGSIYPTDISLDTTAEGTKMLRSYIEFAIDGPSILERAITPNNIVNIESPFEESVYDFLVSEGYNIETQVGCSGYRIDLAVKHPTLDGRYVLGIECDGATYHSSRTARERDRLRQSVLEEIGWKIYRVWSTDWIKDPRTEGKKLKEAVEKALATYSDPFFEKLSPNQTKKSNSEDYVIEASEMNEGSQIKNSITSYGNELKLNNKSRNNLKPEAYSYYIEADIFEISDSYRDFSTFCQVVKHIVNVETPIHFELLCKRVIPLFGNKRVTARIKKEVTEAIQVLSNDIYEVDNFLYTDSLSIKPRIPRRDDIPRPITYIAQDELMQILLFAISSHGELNWKQLYYLVSHKLRLNQTESLREILENAYSSLLETEIIVERNGYVSLS